MPLELENREDTIIEGVGFALGVAILAIVMYILKPWED